MSAQVLSFFWELAALDVDRRVKAAAALIGALSAAQADHAGDGLCPDLQYAVRRLVRGLASPRDGARQGFGAALIELLNAFDEVTPEEILEQVRCPALPATERRLTRAFAPPPRPSADADVGYPPCRRAPAATTRPPPGDARDARPRPAACAAPDCPCRNSRPSTFPLSLRLQMAGTLQLTGSIKGSEERDLLFGHLFACGAVVRSGRVPRLPLKRRLAVAAKLSAKLLSCGSAKAFLLEPAAALACELLKSLPAADVEAAIWPNLAPLLAPPMAEWQGHQRERSRQIGPTRLPYSAGGRSGVVAGRSAAVAVA